MGTKFKSNFWLLSTLVLALTTPSTYGGLTSLLVGLGINYNGITKNVEIVELDDKDTEPCNVPDYPYTVYGVIGALGFDDKPLICGGSGDGPNTHQCFALEDFGWYNNLNMSEARAYASVVQSPFKDGKQQLIVTGGNNDGIGIDGISNTAESLTSSGWVASKIPNLPKRLNYHCMVNLNATSIMVIGGVGELSDSGITYIYNSEFNAWSQGPSLKYGRHHHSCAKIRNNSNSSDFSVIVVGGVNGTTMASVEILDQNLNQWREGPELPFGIYRSALVEDGEGGVILVGGQKQDNHYLDTLYHLKDGGLENKMEHPDHPENNSSHSSNSSQPDKGNSTHPPSENPPPHDKPDNHGASNQNHNGESDIHAPPPPPPGNKTQWILLFKKLKIARSFHTAFLIAGCPEIIATTTADPKIALAAEATTTTQATTETTTIMNDETTIATSNTN